MTSMNFLLTERIVPKLAIVVAIGRTPFWMVDDQKTKYDLQEFEGMSNISTQRDTKRLKIKFVFKALIADSFLASNLFRFSSFSMSEFVDERSLSLCRSITSKFVLCSMFWSSTLLEAIANEFPLRFEPNSSLLSPLGSAKIWLWCVWKLT